jgi:hypothetical protein
MAEEKGEIVFGKEELSPEAKEAYRLKIESARKGGVNALKGTEPLGGVPRPVIPDFQRLREAGSAPSGMTESGGVAPRPAGSPILRPETAQQLEDMAQAQKAQAEKEAEKKVEEDPFKKEEESLFDLLNSDQRNEAERLLNNKKRREEIESRCAPMKFEDLLFKNEVHQKVPIIPERFEPTFRSITPEESLFVKRYIAKEQSISDQYLLEKYNICLLACALLAINDSMLPDHRDLNGSPDEKLFEAKLKGIFKKSGYIVADLGINYTWFDIRVRKLITADGLKNG